MNCVSPQAQALHNTSVVPYSLLTRQVRCRMIIGTRKLHMLASLAGRFAIDIAVAFDLIVIFVSGPRL